MFMYLWKESSVGDIEGKFVRGVKCPVVYIFLGKNNKCLYVGKTTNFCSRWSQHVRGENPIAKVKKVILMTYESVADAVFMESQLIVQCQPEWNKQGLDEKESKMHIDQTATIELKVLTKHLDAFLQQQYKSS